jgi:hypothetical protein
MNAWLEQSISLEGVVSDSWGTNTLFLPWSADSVW